MGKLSDEEDGSETTAGPATDELPSEPATPTPVPDGEKVEGEEPIDPSRPQWPSMQDLNSRLRKVITSYQRNFKKEELKLAQKAKVSSKTSFGKRQINQILKSVMIVDSAF